MIKVGEVKEGNKMLKMFEYLTVEELNKVQKEYVNSSSGRMVENKPTIQMLKKYWIEELEQEIFWEYNMEER